MGVLKQKQRSSNSGDILKIPNRWWTMENLLVELQHLISDSKRVMSRLLGRHCGISQLAMTPETAVTSKYTSLLLVIVYSDVQNGFMCTSTLLRDFLLQLEVIS